MNTRTIDPASCSWFKSVIGFSAGVEDRQPSNASDHRLCLQVQSGEQEHVALRVLHLEQI